ncbi:MAG: hypothetical protein NC040_08995 [Muribaculaceae bacterium]|nr:hypothetical protein [Alistipes senegalensis]MCM1474183.1 hypothetical protein [Muribaculaceae bacterium]
MRKGIIYRELYLNRKRYIIGFAMYIAMLFIGILVRLSMNFGNLAHADGEVFTGMDVVTYYMFTLATPMILIISFAETPEIIFSDYKTNWTRFSYTFPISSKEMALYKTGISFTGYLISVIISIVNFCIFCPLCDRKFDIFNFKIMIILMFCFCIATTTEQILTYKFKNVTLTQTVTSLIFTVIFVAVGGGMTVYISKAMDKYSAQIQNGDMSGMDIFLEDLTDKLRNFMDVFIIFVPFLIVGIFVLEYFLTKKILSRREK